MKSIKHVLVLASIIILAASCSDDDPVAVNEEEVITTLTVTLTPEDGDVVTLTSTDLDGDGPNAPVITVSNDLAINTTYTGVTKVLNETETPAENITLEVLEEGVDHQFFYTFSGDTFSTSYTDLDQNGDPIGINFTLTTTGAGSENVTISLIHEPNKSGANVTGGDITNAAGETDVEATFTLTVQ